MQVVPSPDVLNFANLIGPGGMEFGIVQRKAVIAKLREIADRIEGDEAPRIVLQEAATAKHMQHDDYSFTYIVLKFAELAKTAPIGTCLYGSDRFPIEVKSEAAKSFSRPSATTAATCIDCGHLMSDHSTNGCTVKMCYCRRDVAIQIKES